jgi:1-acyl-sn-glycerol-3-phosphate acyltransferase
MIIKFLREISFTSFWWVVLGLDVFCLAVFVTILPGRSRNRIGLRVATSVLLKAAGVEVSVKGLENITTNQPYVFVANHQSWFDSFVLAAILPVPLAFAPKKEMYRVPVCSYTMRRLHFVCVDRTHPRIPIIPVILVGTREIMPRDTFWISYGRRVKVIILNPLSVSAADRGEQMAITEKIRQQIAGILEHQRSNNGVLD